MFASDLDDALYAHKEVFLETSKFDSNRMPGKYVQHDNIHSREVCSGGAVYYLLNLISM